MARGARLSPDIEERRRRLYELAPQMRLYHRVLESQVWEPFVMRACLPNIAREALHTDTWGLRHTVGREARVLTVESVERGEPLDIVIGTSFCFGVGASSDEATLPSRLAQATGRATVSLSGHQHALAQSFVQFMFHAGRFDRIRNIVIAGYAEPFFAETADAIFRSYGLFPFERRFMTALNGPLEGQKAAALYGANGRPFMPLTRRPDRRAAERAALIASIRNVLTTWSRFARGIGARLVVVLQPLPQLQARCLSPEEEELLPTWDAVSGVSDALERAVEDYRSTHRGEMEAMAGELGFDWHDVNGHLGSAHDGRWLHIDRIHLTDLGYRLAAEAIVPRLAD